MTEHRPTPRFEEDEGAGYLRAVGLRPTQQRLALAGLLFAGEDRHVTAESLYEEATAQGVKGGPARDR